MIEIFTNEATHSFTTSLDNDQTLSAANDLDLSVFSDFSIGVGSNLALVKGLFPFRRAAFNFWSTLRTSVSQIKVKDLALVLEPARDAFEKVS